jgi:hypothetical protein
MRTPFSGALREYATACGEAIPIGLCVERESAVVLSGGAKMKTFTRRELTACLTDCPCVDVEEKLAELFAATSSIQNVTADQIASLQIEGAAKAWILLNLIPLPDRTLFAADVARRHLETGNEEARAAYQAVCKGPSSASVPDEGAAAKSRDRAMAAFCAAFVASEACERDGLIGLEGGSHIDKLMSQVTISSDDISQRTSLGKVGIGPAMEFVFGVLPYSGKRVFVCGLAELMFAANRVLQLDIDPRSEDAVRVSRNFAQGEQDETQLHLARSAAKLALGDARARLEAVQSALDAARVYHVALPPVFDLPEQVDDAPKAADGDFRECLGDMDEDEADGYASAFDDPNVSEQWREIQEERTAKQNAEDMDNEGRGEVAAGWVEDWEALKASDRARLISDIADWHRSAK